MYQIRQFCVISAWIRRWIIATPETFVSVEILMDCNHFRLANRSLRLRSVKQQESSCYFIFRYEGASLAMLSDKSPQNSWRMLS